MVALFRVSWCGFEWYAGSSELEGSYANEVDITTVRSFTTSFSGLAKSILPVVVSFGCQNLLDAEMARTVEWQPPEMPHIATTTAGVWFVGAVLHWLIHREVPIDPCGIKSWQRTGYCFYRPIYMCLTSLYISRLSGPSFGSLRFPTIRTIP